MHPRTTSLTFAPRRIGKTNFSETARARLDIARFWVGKQSELQCSQGLFKLKRGNPFREDSGLDERQQLLRGYHTEAYYIVAVTARPQECQAIVPANLFGILLLGFADGLELVAGSVGAPSSERSHFGEIAPPCLYTQQLVDCVVRLRVAETGIKMRQHLN